MVSLHIRSKKEYPIEYPTDYPRFVVLTLTFACASTVVLGEAAVTATLDARITVATFAAVEALAGTVALFAFGAAVLAGRAWATEPTYAVKSEADVLRRGIC
jgi:hypothetical protein